MKYFHVRLYYNSRHYVDVVDLTEDDLLKRVVDPYKAGVDSFINGTLIKINKLSKVTIITSKSTYENLFWEWKREEHRELQKQYNPDNLGIKRYKAKDSVWEYAPNVTDSFINGAPGYETSPPENKTKTNSDQVFIVHGHDDGMKYEISDFIRSLKLEPIILHEQSSSGMTIIEKIENYSNVGFGVVLYSPCDIGAKHEGNYKLKPRARQNVVFEHGYLIGKIGRSNVCAIVKDEIEKPNDISGVVYVPMSGDWKLRLIKELNSSGYKVKLN